MYYGSTLMESFFVKQKRKKVYGNKRQGRVIKKNNIIWITIYIIKRFLKRLLKSNKLILLQFRNLLINCFFEIKLEIRLRFNDHPVKTCEARKSPTNSDEAIKMWRKERFFCIPTKVISGKTRLPYAVPLKRRRQKEENHLIRQITRDNRHPPSSTTAFCCLPIQTNFWGH